MIKKTLLGLGITFLSFISFSSAYFYPTINIELPGNFYHGGTDFNSISSALNFTSDNGKYIHIIDNNNEYRIFRNNGKIYLYGYYGYFGEYTQGYYVDFCKVIGTGYCGGGYTEEIGNEFYNLSGVNFTNFIGSFQGETDDPGFCFYNLNNNTNYCTQVYDEHGNYLITGSLNILNGEDNFSSYAQYSPFFINGGTTPNINTTCPTIRELMQNMGKNYNTGLCYNNTNYYNGTNFVQIEKEDIFTIFNNDYQNYINRISIYRNNCNAPATSQNCGNAFSGEFKKFSIISNAINSKVDEKNLWNYCNLGLNYNPNATTCTLNGTGIIKEEYTTEEEIQNIINNGAIPTPNTSSGNNNVINVLNNCENGDRECYINDRNFIESLSNIYGKITGIFKERKNVNGIIPEYILRITFITILFTVIFKK